ncbi:hypothetical protein [Aliiglaciecola sp. LCG003]|uniref:hypothetical protein n=1 Tax=Aliiglaciecola sp. LCG003 TaxID=3053655 RepID=UPI002573BB2F|nr:hypothetical protein [Aliiglaciecola sp. LCG003]WJG08884.1 hypothetical protein QR722_16330 [Aliiglaciecola sp. LCG003]
MKFNLKRDWKITSSCLLYFALSIASQAQESAQTDLSAVSCPADFYAIPLFKEARMCQIFAEDLPASMTYHAQANQQTTSDFYLQQLGQAQRMETHQGRILMAYDNDNKIIIISKDGGGTQVDILVKS